METREKALKIFLEARNWPGFSVSWEKHSRNVAKIAEAVAMAVNKYQEEYLKLPSEINVDEAYAAGLLHDIGRTLEENPGLRHPIIGYEFLKSVGMEIPARISMTHTYYDYYKIDRTEFWEEIDEASTKFTQDYMQAVELTDIDLLIQLADNMGHNSGIMTVSDRFCEILSRHRIRSATDHVRALYNLKQYFDKKAGINIYELFRDEIIRTTMIEPNGIMRERQQITDETEEKL